MMTASIQMFPIISMLSVSFMLAKMHILTNLIIVEYLTITSIVMMFIFMKLTSTENYLILYLVILMITESIVGLSLMINMIRTHGNDFIKSSLILKL